MHTSLQHADQFVWEAVERLENLDLTNARMYKKPKQGLCNKTTKPYINEKRTLSDVHYLVRMAETAGHIPLHIGAESFGYIRL